MREIQKLSPKHWVRTYYTCAAIFHELNIKYVIYVVVPVDVYRQGEMEYEIIPVEMLAKNCPWNMENTCVKIHSEHTDIDGLLLSSLVEVTPEAARNLQYLDTVDHVP